MASRLDDASKQWNFKVLNLFVSGSPKIVL